LFVNSQTLWNSISVKSQNSCQGVCVCVAENVMVFAFISLS
jgi:hypothetical protein